MSDQTPPAVDVEKAVITCPQCDGEGGYPDGVDEAACHTDCTRCDGAGWIVDTAAIAAMPTRQTDRIAALESEVERLRGLVKRARKLIPVGHLAWHDATRNALEPRT